MKRRLLNCTVYAALIGLALLCALGMQRPITGAGGISANTVGFAGKPQSQYQTYHNVYTMNPALDHAAVNINGVTGAIADSVKVDNQDRAIVIADSMQDLGLGHVYTLGVDDTTFAYALLDTLRAPAVCDTMVINSNRRTHVTIKSGADWNLNVAGSARPRSMIVHFDPKVPSGATIVRATFHLNAEGVYSTASTDSINATLMSNAGWGAWYHYRGLWNTWNNSDPGSGDTWYKYGAKSGYTNQVQYKTATDRHGYHYTSRSPWYPAWSTINRYFDAGTVTDRTSLGNKDGTSARVWDLAIDITDCVQAIANGATNNGILITPKISTAANRTIYTHGFECDQRVKRAGWFEVVYSDKPYSAPFPGGKTWAFVFQTDDARKTANDAYYQTFADHEGKYTIYATKDFLGTSGIATAADLLNWYNTGNEIGVHSRHHIYADAYQINRWGHGAAANGYAASDTTTYAAGWDSMRTSLSPAWMYALGDSLGIPRHSRRWAKSMALPGNQWSSWTQVLCTQLGYQSVRCGQSGQIGIPATTGLGLAFSDSAVSGMQAALGRAPRNILMLPIYFGIESIVGAKTNTTITESEVKANAKKLIEQIKADGRPVLSLFVHDFKTDPSGTGYAEGLDQEELDWLLDVVDAEGGCYMTATEYVDFMRANSVAIDRPHSAHRDSFPFFNSEAQSKAWIRPNGIENRWIPTLYNATAGLTYDTIKPSAPASLDAYGADQSVTLVWTASSSPDVQIYKIYRFFDGSPDTTLLAAQSSVYTVGGYCTYTDNSAVNGSPHNYFVTAVDAAANESADSPHAYDTPMANQLSPGRPAYFALWFDDPGSGLSATSRDSILNILDDFDAVVTGPFAMEGIVREDFYDDLVSDLRQRNSDEIVLMYVNPWMVRYSPADTASQLDRNYTRRIMDYADSGADSSGYALNDAAHIVRGYEYRVATTGSQTRVINFMRAGAADTMAFIWAEAYEKLATGMQGNYTGLFVDDLSVVPGYLMQISGAPGYDSFADVVDANQDSTPFGSDDEEKAAFEAYHVAFLKALRREFAQRGLDNRLIVGNTTFGRADEPGTNAVAAFGLMDGAMIEGTNVWWPGTAAADTTWDKAFAIRTLLENSQVSPPMGMIMMAMDSSAVYQSEVLALASDTWVNASKDAHTYNAPLSLPRRLPNPGLSTGYAISEGGADPDTLTANWTNLTARMWLQRNPVNADSTYAVWPYIVYTADGDTLSQSLFYERADEIGAPPAPEYSTLNGDEQITVIFRPAQLYGDGGSQYDAGWTTDLRRIGIQIAPAVGDADTAYVDPDTLNYWSPAVEGGDDDDWLFWTNTGLTNGLEYCYRMWAEDWVGNKSNVITHADQCRTPEDNASPQTPENLIAKGWLGAVDLDWSDSRDIDMAGYIINRSDGGEFGQLKTILADAWNPHSYTTDSTAVSGQTYEYYVEAFDDEDNLSAPSDTVSGGWMGTGGTYPPPSNVRVLADNPSGSTAVVVYPPTDTTGLTGYTVYRGYKSGLAAVDTADCIKRISINGTPDAFNGYVYYDNTANTSPDSAFQYTARALYSGNASAKYAVPAWCLTTGGISSQAPTVYAYGRGTDIGVAVGPVAGCDSTRIFRGTTATTQDVHVATVLATNNPYIDTTALANTDYYYKVRQSASGGTILTEFSNVFGPVRWTGCASGDPAISGITGTIANGQSVSIAGCNFGGKTTAAPLVWDDFEEGSGSIGATIPVTSGTGSVGWKSNGSSNGEAYVPKYTNADVHAGSVASYHNFSSGNYNSGLWTWGPEMFRYGAFVDGWFKYVSPTNVPYQRSAKMYEFFGDQGKNQSNPSMNATISQCGTGDHHWAVYPHGDTAPGQTYSDVNSSIGSPYSYNFIRDRWVHVQCWIKPGTPYHGRTTVLRELMSNPSGPMHVQHNRTDLMNNFGPEAGQTYSYMQSCAIGYYSTHDGNLAYEPNCIGNPGDAAIYWDNVYIDNEQSRVEIGDNATYALCTHREIQIPTAWATNGTSITVTLNTGSFENGTAYLFVVDSDGNVSAGTEITIANP